MTRQSSKSHAAGHDPDVILKASGKDV